MGYLVSNFILFFCPCFENYQRFIMKQLFDRNTSLSKFFFNVFMECTIVKSDIRSIVLSISIIDFIDSCPSDRSITHRTGFAGSIYLTAFQIECSKIFTSITDSNHFTVSCWIIAWGHLISSFSHDRSIFYNNRPEWSSCIFLYILHRQSNCLSHKFFFFHSQQLNDKMPQRWNDRSESDKRC